MKKHKIILLTVICCVILAACGNEEQDVAETNDIAVDQSAFEKKVPVIDVEITETEPDNEPIYADGTEIGLDESWQYAGESAIHTGSAVFYAAADNRNGIVVAVNAGHGTKGGTKVKTYCHPDHSAKTTGGSTAEGATQATAVSAGTTFTDGTSEATVTLQEAKLVRDKLLAAGFDVLMLRDGEDVQLDNVARTVIANNVADCHIAIHWNGDDATSPEGVFYIRVPDAIKGMEPVASYYKQHDALGQALVDGLVSVGNSTFSGGSMAIDLTQTSYSTIPSVDVELGNQCSDHSQATLDNLADGIVLGVEGFFSKAD